MGRTLRLMGALVALTLMAAPLRAQREVPRNYAITNARIVTVSGPVIERGTVVVRNGLITAVGPNVEAPADARVINGDGLTVYPGLIDAYGSIGQPRPVAGGGGGAAAQQAATRSTGNSNYPASIRPENLAADQLSIDQATLEALHSAGLTMALTGGSIGVFRGQSALVNLGAGAPLAMVVKSPVGQYLGFSSGGGFGGGGGGGGGYPGSLMGVITSIRQLLFDAQRYRDHLQAYNRTPRGISRPELDPALEALQPVLARQQPIIMAASTRREIERALDIAKEFNLRLIIAGGNEAHLVADRLKAQDAVVLLSTNFPRRTAAPAEGADPEPISLLRTRVESPTVAGKLVQAGVKTALQSGGLTAWNEFIPNLRRAVEGGLSSEQAIRALTLTPAEVFGVADRLGSIEVGKIANLTLVRGNLFESSGRVAGVLVDGRHYEASVPTTRPNGPGLRGTAGAEGVWTLAVAVDGESKELTMMVREEADGKLVGVFQGDFGSGEINHGIIAQDGTFQFSAILTLSGTAEEAWFAGRWSADSVSGEVAIVGSEAGRFVGLRAERANR